MKLQERLREHDMLNGRYGVTASVADEAAAQLDLYEAALREIGKGSIGAASDWSAEECADYWAKQALRCRSLARSALNQTDTGA